MRLRQWNPPQVRLLGIPEKDGTVIKKDPLSRRPRFLRAFFEAGGKRKGNAVEFACIFACNRAGRGAIKK